MQEDATEEGSGADASLAHPAGVGLVDFRLQQADDQREEHLAKDGRPLRMVACGELGGEQRALEGRKGLLPDLAAGVDALRREGLEDGGPVGGPCCRANRVSFFLWRKGGRRRVSLTFVGLEVRFGDQALHAPRELINSRDRLYSPRDDLIVPDKPLARGWKGSIRKKTHVGFAFPDFPRRALLSCICSNCEPMAPAEA